VPISTIIPITQAWGVYPRSGLKKSAGWSSWKGAYSEHPALTTRYGVWGSIPAAQGFLSFVSPEGGLYVWQN